MQFGRSTYTVKIQQGDFLINFDGNDKDLKLSLEAFLKTEIPVPSCLAPIGWNISIKKRKVLLGSVHIDILLPEAKYHSVFVERGGKKLR